MYTHAKKAIFGFSYPTILIIELILKLFTNQKSMSTGFDVFLGACEHVEKPFERAVSREEYLEEYALRAALCYALDVNDFRAYLGLTVDEASDDRLIETMHRDRAKSICIPAEIRTESKVWLARHETVP